MTAIDLNFEAYEPEKEKFDEKKDEKLEKRKSKYQLKTLNFSFFIQITKSSSKNYLIPDEKLLKDFLIIFYERNKIEMQRKSI